MDSIFSCTKLWEKTISNTERNFVGTTARTRESTFFINALFADEATVHSNGCVNNHNFHYYLFENLKKIKQISNQHNLSINVWEGMIEEHVVGAYFLKDHLNGQINWEWLTNQLPESLPNLPGNI